MMNRPVLRLAPDAGGVAVIALIARWRDAVKTLTEFGAEREAAVVRRLVGELEAALDAGSPAVAAKAPEDRLLTVAETARRLGVSPAFIHRHWRSLPHLRGAARKLGSRTLRFSATALTEHINRSAA